MNSGNLKGLYANIGAAVDKALGLVNGEYENMISKAATTEKKLLKVKRLIEQYAIGVIVLDEIQNLAYGSNHEQSFEALLTLNGQTNVAFVVIGTEDAYNKIFSSERMARRVSTLIDTDKQYADEDTFEKHLRIIFKNQWFDENATLTKELSDLYKFYSEKIIWRMITLHMCLNIHYLSKKKVCPEKDISIDKELFQEMLDEYMPELKYMMKKRRSKKLLQQKEELFKTASTSIEANITNKIKSIQEDIAAKEYNDALDELMNEPNENNEINVIRNIQMCFDYSIQEIQEAYRKIIPGNNNKTVNELTKLTIAELLPKEKQPRTKNSRLRKETQIDIGNALKQSMM